MSGIVDQINEWADMNEISLLLIGADKEEVEKYAPAIVGVTDGYWTTDEHNDRIAVVYDEDKLIEIIAKDIEPMGDPDNPDDQYNDVYFIAREHFDYNIKGGWHGKHTPIFVNTFAWERELEEKLNESDNR